MTTGTDLSAWMSAFAAVLSAAFAAIAWYSWRAQFRLSFPYVETDYEPLANAHLIHWNKRGPHAEDWSVDWVTIKGANARLARYRSLMRPNKGSARVGEVTNIGLRQCNPESPLVIVEQMKPAQIVLTFLLRSKAHPALKKKIRCAISLTELPNDLGGSGPELFSGQMEVRF